MTECLFFGFKKKNLLNWDPRSVPSIHTGWNSSSKQSQCSWSLQTPALKSISLNLEVGRLPAISSEPPVIHHLHVHAQGLQACAMPGFLCECWMFAFSSRAYTANTPSCRAIFLAQVWFGFSVWRVLWRSENNLQELLPPTLHNLGLKLRFSGLVLSISPAEPSWGSWWVFCCCFETGFCCVSVHGFELETVLLP